MLKNELFIYSFFKFWRWFPIGDHFVDVFLSRDTDSQIFQREVDAVNYWLYANKTAHIMRGILRFSYTNFSKEPLIN